MKMKKVYSKPELELVTMEEDVITASGTKYTFDGGNFFTDGNGETWNW